MYYLIEINVLCEKFIIEFSHVLYPACIVKIHQPNVTSAKHGVWQAVGGVQQAFLFFS